MTAPPIDPPAPSAPVLDVKLPPIPRSLGVYDGPVHSADRQLEAQLLATTRCALHPLYRRSPGDCFTLLYRAQALNIPVGVALDHIYINTAIGRAGLSAQLMAALLLRAGVTWKTPRCTDQIVEMVFYRGRKKIGGVTWKITEAVAAGLTKRDRWRLWPVDCLWARAMARGCRRFFSDVVMGMGYTPEEVADMGTDADSAPEQSEQIDPAVQDFLDQADSESATADLIRTDILKRAKKARLHAAVLPDGRTLEAALLDVWRIKTAQEVAARADEALTVADAEPEEAAAVLDAPAGEGKLSCDCPAAAVIAGDGHLAKCTEANVRA